MKMTSAEANKYLKKLNDEKQALIRIENDGKEFVAAMGEPLEDARTDYDYAAVQQQLEELNRKIRSVKHAINVFNTTTVVPELGMTIDQVLVYIPQLSGQRSKLFGMKATLPKVRQCTRREGSLVEYVYVNYDIAAAAADYEKVDALLTKAQTALDLVNSTEMLEVDI